MTDYIGGGPTMIHPSANSVVAHVTVQVNILTYFFFVVVSPNVNSVYRQVLTNSQYSLADQYKLNSRASQESHVTEGAHVKTRSIN